MCAWFKKLRFKHTFLHALAIPVEGNAFSINKCLEVLTDIRKVMSAAFYLLSKYTVSGFVTCPEIFQSVVMTGLTSQGTECLLCQTLGWTSLLLSALCFNYRPNLPPLFFQGCSTSVTFPGGAASGTLSGLAPNYDAGFPELSPMSSPSFSCLYPNSRMPYVLLSHEFDHLIIITSRIRNINTPLQWALKT